MQLNPVSSFMHVCVGLYDIRRLAGERCTQSDRRDRPRWRLR